MHIDEAKSLLEVLLACQNAERIFRDEYAEAIRTYLAAYDSCNAAMQSQQATIEKLEKDNARLKRGVMVIRESAELKAPYSAIMRSCSVLIREHGDAD